MRQADESELRQNVQAVLADSGGQAPSAKDCCQLPTSAKDGPQPFAEIQRITTRGTKRHEGKFRDGNQTLGVCPNPRVKGGV